LIFRLQKKHRVNDVASLLLLQNDLYKKINSISIHTEELEELAVKNSKEKKQLIDAAKKIS